MLTIYRGASFIFGITVQTPAGGVFDLTGATARAEIRKRAAPTSALVLNLAPTISTPASGIISINVAAAITAELEPQTAKWDLLVDMPGGDTLVIVPTEDIEVVALSTAPV